MEDELALFVQTAGTTLVALMATDAFQRTKDGVLGMWRRVRPGESEAVGEQMDATRAALLHAQTDGNEDRAQELSNWWQERLSLLFDADPSTAETLRKALAHGASHPISQDAPRIGRIQLRARGQGHARIFQAGRDQHIVDG
ncbi:hypothetical protein ACFVXG_19695 [Kitasatospora sp. NPDC058162]|uniref:hypothetical protein n=1 Tax=Kitasatospora sp. NPDC058162 TaxID=3346362 RepID=UPI0036DAB6F9